MSPAYREERVSQLVMGSQKCLALPEQSLELMHQPVSYKLKHQSVARKNQVDLEPGNRGGNPIPCALLCDGCLEHVVAAAAAAGQVSQTRDKLLDGVGVVLIRGSWRAEPHPVPLGRGDGEGSASHLVRISAPIPPNDATSWLIACFWMHGECQQYSSPRQGSDIAGFGPDSPMPLMDSARVEASTPPIRFRFLTLTTSSH